MDKNVLIILCVYLTQADQTGMLLFFFHNYIRQCDRDLGSDIFS